VTAQEHTLRSDAPERTEAIGGAIGTALLPGELVRLYGELGAGKTALVRGLVRALGITDATVNSPTYTIANEYRTDDAFVLHIDAYRLLDDPDDAVEQIGLVDARRRGAIVCVEWPDRLGDAIDDADLDVHLTHAGERDRDVTLRGPALLRDTFLPALERAGATR